MTLPSRISANSGFSGGLFHVFQILNAALSGEQEKESIIRVKKSVPGDYRLSSLGKPCDANR